MVGSPFVLGQAHTSRRRLFPLAVVALAVLVAPSVGGANPSHSAASLRAQDAAIAAKSRGAVLDLYSLDQRFAGAQARLAALRVESASLRAQRRILSHELDVARRGTRISQMQLADRLRALYEQATIEPLEIVLGARSLDEAMTNLDNLSRVTGQGEDVLHQLASARASATRASRGLAVRQAALSRATREAEATAVSLARTRSERNAYISSLAAKRRVTERQLSTLLTEARRAQLRTAELQRQAFSDTASPVSPVAAVPFEPPAAAVAGERTITVSATGYALPGTTATGLPVGWGVVAVDPSLIPLGSHMTIPGYGEGVAADTGSAIVGATIDLWFPTIAQASAWGRRTVTIVLH